MNYKKIELYKKQKAFTLIELLVVISVIGVATGISLNVINAQKQRERATEAVRTANAQKLAQAIDVYAEAEGSLPTQTDLDSPSSTFRTTYVSDWPFDANNIYQYVPSGSSYNLVVRDSDAQFAAGDTCAKYTSSSKDVKTCTNCDPASGTTGSGCDNPAWTPAVTPVATPTGAATPALLANYVNCSADSQCQSGHCWHDPADNTMACLPYPYPCNTRCSSASQCASTSCVSGRCNCAAPTVLPTPTNQCISDTGCASSCLSGQTGVCNIVSGGGNYCSCVAPAPTPVNQCVSSSQCISFCAPGETATCLIVNGGGNRCMCSTGGSACQGHPIGMCTGSFVCVNGNWVCQNGTAF